MASVTRNGFAGVGCLRGTAWLDYTTSASNTRYCGKDASYYEVGVWKFVMPAFTGVSTSANFGVYVYSSASNLRLRWALCSSDANKTSYCNTSGAVSEGYQLASGTVNSSGTGYRTLTFTANTSAIKSNTTYYLIIWTATTESNLCTAQNVGSCYATVNYNQTYTISYNANGGSGAPGNQTKVEGTNLTLSTTKPTKASASAGSYTVTFNANGGSCSTASLAAARTTKYTFKNWNTNSGGTGTSYESGGTYSANAAATLYAQYTGSTSTAAITLPTATRSGYDFLGWGTSASATSGKTGSYTPTKTETLYAVWKALGLVYIDNGSSIESYQIYIDNGSGWDLYAPHVDNGSGWNLCS